MVSQVINIIPHLVDLVQVVILACVDQLLQYLLFFVQPMPYVPKYLSAPSNQLHSTKLNLLKQPKHRAAIRHVLGQCFSDFSLTTFMSHPTCEATYAVVELVGQKIGCLCL